jgi:hypothetical protein
MPNITVQNGDHTMKHIIFFILGALILIGLILGTGYFKG